MSGNKSIIIGIDLGTTYSGAAVFSNDFLRMITDARGNVIIPSMVAFSENGTLVGDDVPFQKAQNPENTIYDAKRFIGRNFNDQMIKSGILVKRWPFKIVNDSGKIQFEVTNKGNKEKFRPEEISALILKRLKDTCEKNLGQEIKDAVVSVPAYFNDNQRNATMSAGKIAGLNVLRIMNEPTAAALAYDYGRSKFGGDQTILVYDLGGGTFDVSIVNISGNDLLVRATSGDSNLGGQDFTYKICNYCIEDFKTTHGATIQMDQTAISRLTDACENAKRRLSAEGCNEAEVSVSLLGRNSENVRLDYSKTITRSNFEEMNRDSFNYTMDIVKNCMKDAKISPSEIDEVVLVGGSTRIPKIIRILQEMFTPQKVNRRINPDEAIALGAAIQASILRGDKNAWVINKVLFDVTPLSLGTDVRNNEMSVVIKKNTLIPVRMTSRYWTVNDNQTVVHCGVYQGERANVNDNFFLGEFNLTGLRKAPKDEVKVDVTFDLNTDGILVVTAQEVKPDGSASGNIKSIEIKNCVGRLSNEEIQRMIQRGKMLEASDAKFRRKSLRKNELDRYCHDVSQYISLNKTKRKLSASAYEECQKETEAVVGFLSREENCDLEDYEDWLEKMKDTCGSLIGKMFLEDNHREIGQHTPILTTDVVTPQNKPSTKYSPD